MSNLVYEPDPKKRPGFTFNNVCRTWEEWAEVHKELGQELAKRMRVYPGPAESDDPPEGGTPVLMRRAA